ncbi:lipopolysaccharide biosynthesis protein [Emticicia sp. 21SJ11W-3]|uniref:lipopolysaccharide biosynthesis protein n=1 Tax=Emticicia sp. 21SJ11W-3 TaxID=2916755 RepID=UPI00209CF81F|nr:oligosaccharide flippase family protein [Emticicia sp. 21SJ11W-3]UTA69019.1 oligosaccharide flippase family protein [Emticicia sp. 21SJ11W-3]
MNVIKKQAFISTIFSYAGVLVGFISWFFVFPNFFKKEEIGLLQVLLSYMYVMVQLSSLGFNAAGSRFFVRFRDAKKGHNGFLFLGLAVGITGFLFCSIGVYFLKDWMIARKGENNLLADNFYFLLPITFATLLFNLFDNYAKNLYETVTGTFLSQFLQRFLLLASSFLVVFHVLDFAQYIWVWVLAFSFYVIPMIWKASKLDGFSLKPDFSLLTPQFIKQFATYSILTILTGFSSMIILYIDKIMLAEISTLEETGIYSTAAFFGSVMGMSLLALNKASAPIIVDSFAANDLKNIDTIYRKSCTTSLIVGCWIFLGIYLNIDNLFAFLPAGYEEGKWVIIILSLGKLFDLATGLNGTILTLSPYYKYDTYIMISLIGLTVFLNWLLIPMYGINGAAFALALSTIYYNAVRYAFVWWKLGMQPFTIDIPKVLLIMIVAGFVISLLPTLGGNKFRTVIDIVYRSAGVTLLYGVIIYWSKVSPELNGAMTNLWKAIVKLGKK